MNVSSKCSILKHTLFGYRMLISLNGCLVRDFCAFCCTQLGKFLIFQTFAENSKSERGVENNKKLMVTDFIFKN